MLAAVRPIGPPSRAIASRASPRPRWERRGGRGHADRGGDEADAGTGLDLERAEVEERPER